MYLDCKVYGPYTRKDGRQHVVVIFPNGKRKTVSYPKYLTELRIGRYLKDNETVDHFDKDVSNNDKGNLIVMDRSTHAALDVRRLKAQKFECPTCKQDFELTGPRLSYAISNTARGSSGPFCSRTCAGKYGKSVQVTGKSLTSKKIEPKYYTHKELLSRNA